MRLAPYICVAAGLAACGGKGATTSPCDPTLEQELAGADPIPAQHRTAIAAAAIAERCADPAHPLPAGLRDALTAVSRMGDGGLAVVAPGMAELLAQDPDLWAAACGRPARDVARDLQSLAADAGRGTGLLTLCPVDRLGFAHPDELGDAAPGPLMLAGLTHAWLVREGMAPARAAPLVRLVAGLAPR